MSHTKSVRTSVSSPKAPTVDFSGKWSNQIGSTMELTISGQEVSGVYTSIDSSSGAQAIGYLLGWADGDLISFTVNWRDFLSITAWTGQLVEEAGKDAELRTLWLLVKDVEDADEPKRLWTSTMTGADVFKRA